MVENQLLAKVLSCPDRLSGQCCYTGKCAGAQVLRGNPTSRVHAITESSQRRLCKRRRTGEHAYLLIGLCLKLSWFSRAIQSNGLKMESCRATFWMLQNAPMTSQKDPTSLPLRLNCWNKGGNGINHSEKKDFRKMHDIFYCHQKLGIMLKIFYNRREPLIRWQALLTKAKILYIDWETLFDITSKWCRFQNPQQRADGKYRNSHSSSSLRSLSAIHESSMEPPISTNRIWSHDWKSSIVPVSHLNLFYQFYTWCTVSTRKCEVQGCVKEQRYSESTGTESLTMNLTNQKGHWTRLC